VLVGTAVGTGVDTGALVGVGVSVVLEAPQAASSDATAIALNIAMDGFISRVLRLATTFHTPAYLNSGFLDTRKDVPLASSRVRSVSAGMTTTETAALTEDGGISGKTTDTQTGNPIAGATIQCTCPAGSASTGSSGIAHTTRLGTPLVSRDC
jgi:hypothetical protein